MGYREDQKMYFQVCLEVEYQESSKCVCVHTYTYTHINTPQDTGGKVEMTERESEHPEGPTGRASI